MSRVFDGTSAYLLTDNCPVTTYPITISAWVKPSRGDANESVVGLSNSAGAETMIHLRGDQSINPIEGAARNTSGTFGQARTSTGFTTNNWHHVIARFVANNSRNVLLNGGGQGTNSQNITVTGLNRVTVGARRTGVSSIVALLQGKIAEVSLYKVNLSDTDAISLSGGGNPLTINKSNLVAYWPLYGEDDPEPNLRFSNNPLQIISATGDTEDHPNVDPPPEVVPSGNYYRRLLTG